MCWTQFIAATWCHVSRWMKIIMHNLEYKYEDWIQDKTLARFFPAKHYLFFKIYKPALIWFSSNILESSRSTWKIFYEDFHSNSMFLMKQNTSNANNGFIWYFYTTYKQKIIFFFHCRVCFNLTLQCSSMTPLLIRKTWGGGSHIGPFVSNLRADEC